MNSNQKGKRGEREFAALCRANGYDCRRGQQYSGIEERGRRLGLPNIHIEVKRVEKLNIHNAMDQSIRDASEKLPIVAHRRNDCAWLITMPVEAWFELYREYEAGLK